MNTKYVPIDCRFHDVLLDRATRKKKVVIVYQTGLKQMSIEAIIKDVYTKNKEEFLLTDDGTVIRLDYLLSVDGEEIPKDGICKM